MAFEELGITDLELTFEDIFEPRFATSAERPGFFTEEQIIKLLPEPPPDPDPLDIELMRQAANRRFSSRLTREAFDSLGPNFCGLFPEIAICAAPPPHTGEARIRRPGAPEPSGTDDIDLGGGRRAPRPKPGQDVDIVDALRTRFAEEALLRQRDAQEAAARERGEAAATLAERALEERQRAQEEEFFALTPTQRLRAGLTSIGAPGITRIPSFRIPR